MTRILWTTVIALAAFPVAAKVKVVASLPAWAAVAQAVGGEDVEVESLAAAGEEPHFVDPKPSLVLVLNRAQLLVVNGLDLEGGWLPALVLAARNPAIHVGGAGYFNASAYVQPMDVPAQRVDRSMGDVHPGGNPHFYFDPRVVRAVALALADKLAQVGPEHAEAFRGRAQALHEQLGRQAEAAATRFAAVPADRRRVVSYHRSFPYLYDWLGLTEVATVEPKPGIAPDPGHVAHVLGLLRSKAARAIVQEEYQPTGTSRTLAELGPGRLVVLPGGPRLARGETYADFAQAVTDRLYDGLSHE